MKGPCVWAGPLAMAMVCLGGSAFAQRTRHIFPLKGPAIVTQGQVVGKLGNSGDSNMPHLHYQLMNGPVMFVADGLPFRFENLNETACAPGTYLTPKK